VGARLRPLRPEDWETIRQIYLEGIATGQATFETDVPDWDDWNAAHFPFPRLVATSEDNKVCGWAALTPVSRRTAYAGVGEVSVYVAAAARGRGVGRELLSRLVEESESNGFWTLQASVFPENLASISLHKNCGFLEVGIRRSIGKLNGVWRDTELLERRSTRVGTE
jgi:L-amino acid N-acyltransferase YncA